MGIIYGVEDMATLPPIAHDPEIPQAAEMVRSGRGGDARNLGKVIDVMLTAGQGVHNAGTGGISKGLEDLRDLHSAFGGELIGFEQSCDRCGYVAMVGVIFSVFGHRLAIFAICVYTQM